MLNDLHDELGESGLIIIGVTPESDENATPSRSRDTDTDDATARPVPKFRIFNGSNAIRRYNLTAFPRVYLIDPTGMLVNHFHPIDRMEERIRYQLQKTPPIGMDPTRLRARLVQADRYFNDQEYGKAYTLATSVQRIAVENSDLHTQATEKRDQVIEAADRWLAEALRIARSNEYDKPCRILSELSVRFEHQDVGERAETEIGRLMGDREWKTRLRVAIDNARGEVLNDQAAEYEADGRYLDAIRLFRETTDEYEETAAGKTAQEAIERINADPTAQREIKVLRAEDQADRWLDVGDRYARVQMYSQAREYYQRIIDLASETRAFSRAKQRLEALPEPEPEPEETATDEVGADAEDAEKPAGTTGRKS